MNETVKQLPITYVFQGDNTNFKCNYYITENKTSLIYDGYGGIPENLIINLLCFFVLLIIFTILRKNAWDYGHLALVNKNTKTHHGYSRYNVWTQIFYGGHDQIDSTSQRPVLENSSTPYDSRSIFDKGYLSWIYAIFKLTDSDIKLKCGLDSVQYLSFQRHIIVYMSIVCVLCITIILPLNYQGVLQGSTQEFGHTTLANLNPSSFYLWVHVTLAFLFLPLGIFFARNFSRNLGLHNRPVPVSRTIMFTRVPRKACKKELFMQHFQEAYPLDEVSDVHFSYKIQRLVLLEKEREAVHSAKVYCEEYLVDRRERLEIRPYRCGIVGSCCGKYCCPKVDGLEYYTDLYEQLKADILEEKIRALQQPSGVAFVTFSTIESAKRVHEEHNLAWICHRNMPTSSVSEQLKASNWIANVAPPPDDIYWSNLSVPRKWWYVRAFFINLFLFIVLFFLTTPAVVINSLNLIMIVNEISELTQLSKFNAALSQFLPTLMLWTVAALMPVIVSYSDRFMAHWTRSAENHSIMTKTFVFLLFMLIILPSLGLTSADALVKYVMSNESNKTFLWECMFLPDSGSFFVNYVITSTFIGSALELIRFPELFLYITSLCCARSVAEIGSVRRKVYFEFQFGVQYAWLMLNFAMTIIFSIACPLITPVGLVYLIFKHFVDKYNIYFTYGPSKIKKDVHISAVNFWISSIVFLQCTLLFYSVLRQGLEKPISIYSLVLLCITLLFFVAHVTFHWFRNFSPIIYRQAPDVPTELIQDQDTPDHDFEGLDLDTFQFVSARPLYDNIDKSSNGPSSPKDYGTSSSEASTLDMAFSNSAHQVPGQKSTSAFGTEQKDETVSFRQRPSSQENISGPQTPQ